MSTGQKYSGKGDSTTRKTKKGSSVEPTVNQDPQAVKPTLSVNVFSFDELIVFNGLSDAKKVVVSDLVNSDEYKPHQLSRALLHIAQVPDTEFLSEAFSRDSLQAILASDAEAPDDETQPLTLEGSKEHYCEEISIKLPFFLRWQVRDEQQTKNVLAAIDTIFWEFAKSDLGKKLTEGDDLNNMLAYKALQFSFADVIRKAAEQRGTYCKPKASEYLFEVPKLTTDDKSQEFMPELHQNPKDCTDIFQLQEWVETLQKVAQIQYRTNDLLYKSIDRLEAIGENQQVIIDTQRSQVKQLEQIIEAGKRKEAEVAKENSVPRSKHFVDLHLYLTGGYESEVEAVRDALETASQAKLDKVLEHLTVDETEDAFFVKEEYTKLQNVLSRLTSNLTELAIDNHNRAEFKDNPKWHQDREESHNKDWISRKDEFVDKYSVFTQREDDSAELKNDISSPSNPSQA